MGPVRAIALFSLLASPILFVPGFAQSSAVPVARPVMVGGEAEFDACGGVHKVTGLKTKGDNFLSVRAAPSVKGKELGRLKMGQLVWSCDRAQEGEWIGVVYERVPGQQCGIGTPIAKRRAYAGPCAYGWVSGRFLELVAG
ncbi:hypothetical protein [Novosphingobium sp.]|uniref:hypothetical protein n=1 Tax=Novosphingobium sp. TaxID=1874826 RepID=UPI00286DC2DA|nr:hypothetical protein [Novosphingobium sp.]